MEFFSRITKQQIAKMHSNCIIRYINSNNYRVGIAAKETSHRSKGKISHGTKGNPWEASDFIRELIRTFNNATGAEKTEFLQHAVSQQKLFEIIGGLFLYLSSGWCSRLPFRYLNDLLAMLALEPKLESRFYHSSNFITSTLRVSQNMPHSRELHALCVSASQKYPEASCLNPLIEQLEAVMTENASFERTSRGTTSLRR